MGLLVPIAVSFHSKNHIFQLLSESTHSAKEKRLKKKESKQQRRREETLFAGQLTYENERTNYKEEFKLQ